MRAVEIKKGIYWVGAVDWDLRSFHGYLTQRGSTYNAYLIVDEKVVLVDTVKNYFFDEMLERIRSVVDPEKIDYVVSNHVEMDHSGSLPQIISIAKKAKVITSPNGEKGLKKHYGADWNLSVVATGNSINIGRRNLQFVLTQMVHWPDSMATCIPEEKLLLPNDAFGQHIATSERFDDQVPIDIIKQEAAKYYANIVLPYGTQVKKALDAVSSLDIDMIASSHGLIWRRYLGEIVDCYKKWADNVTEPKAVVVYDTMWKSTEKIAKAISEAFLDKNVPVKLMSLQTNHISDVMTEVLTAKYVCVGSPTLNNGLLPTVSAFLTYMKGLAPTKRVGLSFGSYGWGGQSIKEIGDVLASCGFTTLDPVKVEYVPDKQMLNDLKEKVKQSIGEV
ncbi:MAG: FprA family A-type flavoprotein [Candidatus Omnitrophota bacterium]